MKRLVIDRYLAPAEAGLTTTQASATWDDANLVSTGLGTGTYDDDAVGSVLRSADVFGQQTLSYLFGGGGNATAGDRYFTSDRADLKDVGSLRFKYTDNSDAVITAMGDIVTAVGTETVYKIAMEAKDANYFQPRPLDNTSFYLRFWNSDPSSW